MDIFQEFRGITGFDLSYRRANLLSDKIERKDPFFSLLTILYFSDRIRFNKLKQRINYWLRKEESETLFALAGYIYYIAEDFNKAKKFFLKTIQLNPNNLDNWFDLAFTLRHLGDCEVSHGILFNFDYAIHYYNYLGLKGSGYPRLKRLIIEITKNIRDV